MGPAHAWWSLRKPRRGLSAWAWNVRMPATLQLAVCTSACASGWTQCRMRRQHRPLCAVTAVPDVSDGETMTVLALLPCSISLTTSEPELGKVVSYSISTLPSSCEHHPALCLCINKHVKESVPWQERVVARLSNACRGNWAVRR